MSDFSETTNADSHKETNFLYKTNYGINGFWRSIFAIAFGIAMPILAIAFFVIGLEISKIYTGYDLLASDLMQHILLLLSLALFIPALWFMQVGIHKRKWRDLITGAATFRWSLLLIAIIVYGLAMLFFTVYDWVTGSVTFVYNSETYWSFFWFSILLVPFQAAAEEIMLRGYLNQFLIRYLKNPWVVYIFTSLIFSSLHFANPEANTEYFYQYVVLIFTAGFVACLVCHYTNGLEMAIGVHTINNIIVFTVAGHDLPGEPQTALLSYGEFSITMGETLFALGFHFVMAFILIWLYRKTRWFSPQGFSAP